MTTCEKNVSMPVLDVLRFPLKKKVHLLQQDFMSGVPVSCQGGFMSCTSTIMASCHPCATSHHPSLRNRKLQEQGELLQQRWPELLFFLFSPKSPSGQSI